MTFITVSQHKKNNLIFYFIGVQCWNGPQRSTKVNLRCGAENKLVSAAEPNRCEYEFMFETPAACQPLPPTTHHDEL